MPKVDPQTGEPLSDAPEGPDATRGGMEVGDPGLEGATETGGSGPAHPDTNEADDDTNRELVGEKGGTASGGGA